MRFYHMSPSTLKRLSARRRLSLWLAIDCLEAQELLSLIKATSYPSIKESDRNSFDSKLKSAAYPEEIYVTGAKAVELKDSLLYKLKAKAKANVR